MTWASSRTILATAATAVVVAGCGGHAHRAASQAPKLPADLARQLAARSDEVAARLDAGDDCGALSSARRLQQQMIAAINQRRVPASLQEPLTAAANDLAFGRIQCTRPAPQPKQHHGKGKQEGHGKHKGEGE